MRAVVFAALICVAWAPTVLANQYAQLFKSTSHDFGTVAKAAKTEYRFLFTNTYNKPIHVRSVRTSCGCTTPIIETETVNPGQQGSILARFNTATHSGARGATVTVTFDQPSFGEVQLQVKGYIRTDVVFDPGEVSFGDVVQGEAKSMQVTLEYVGKPTWQITDARCDEPFVHVTTEEKLRQNGRVSYLINVELDRNAPAGPLQSEIVLRTNDRNLTTVPLRLVANVLSEITVNPNLLSLGDVKVEDSIRQLLVVKAQQPFKILEVESDRFHVSAENLSDEAKTLHTVRLVLQPRSSDDVGDVRSKLVIRTDREAKPVIEVDIVHRIKHSLDGESNADPAPERP
jgi:hypothetical protein